MRIQNSAIFRRSWHVLSRQDEMRSSPFSHVGRLSTVHGSSCLGLLQTSANKESGLPWVSKKWWCANGFSKTNYPTTPQIRERAKPTTSLGSGLWWTRRIPWSIRICPCGKLLPVDHGRFPLRVGNPSLFSFWFLRGGKPLVPYYTGKWPHWVGDKTA